MKKILLLALAILSFSSTQVLAGERIEGKVLLNGINHSVSFGTNPDYAKEVTLSGRKFHILTINSTYIEAFSSYASILIYHGDALRSILGKSKKSLQDKFRLENLDEMNCSKEVSQAYLVISADGKNFANCIN